MSNFPNLPLVAPEIDVLDFIKANPQTTAQEIISGFGFVFYERLVLARKLVDEEQPSRKLALNAQGEEALQAFKDRANSVPPPPAAA